MCRDGADIPLPVSVDYNTNTYDCQLITGATDCASAIGKVDATGRTLPAKRLLFCDMASSEESPHHRWGCSAPSEKSFLGLVFRRRNVTTSAPKRSGNWVAVSLQPHPR